MAVVYSKSQ